MRKIKITFLLMAIIAAGAGCSKEQSEAEKPLIFWHSQSDQKAKALREIIDQYNAGNPSLKVREEFVGDYDTTYRKTLTALRAKQPPDLAQAYESMVAEYMKFQAVADLTPYLEAEAKTSDIIKDIYPGFIEGNRYPAYGNQLLSMPFTKSILMLYYNQDMLKEIGRDRPPATWEDFLAVCRQIKQKKGITPVAFSRDASTFDGLVYSFGGQVYDPATRQPLFDRPPALAAFNLIQELFRNNLAREIAYGTYDDRNEFVQKRAAFFIRSSTSRPYVHALIKNQFRWGMAVIPQAQKTPTPRTVLFGANICVFKTTPDRQRAAWKFIHYFLSRDVTATWATRTGYLPVRKSALEVPAFKKMLAEHPANRQTVEALPFAFSEPNVRGWQEIRSLVEKAVSEVIGRRQPPQQAGSWLQKEARRVLVQ
jgi:ABC-type glycerol-3-phosphate transport system substrate-binding protein